MGITNRQVPFTSRVHLSDTVLEDAKEFRDLGMLTNNGLSWNSHIDMITARGKQNVRLD